MLHECSLHANSGWLMSEESIHQAKILTKNVQHIGMPKNSFWIDITAECCTLISPVYKHISATSSSRPDDPLYATAFADQIDMIEISVLYHVFVLQRMIFLESAVPSKFQLFRPVRSSKTQESARKMPKFYGIFFSRTGRTLFQTAESIG